MLTILSKIAESLKNGPHMLQIDSYVEENDSPSKVFDLQMKDHDFLSRKYKKFKYPTRLSFIPQEC